MLSHLKGHESISVRFHSGRRNLSVISSLKQIRWYVIISLLISSALNSLNLYIFPNPRVFHIPHLIQSPKRALIKWSSSFPALGPTQPFSSPSLSLLALIFCPKTILSDLLNPYHQLRPWSMPSNCPTLTRRTIWTDGHTPSGTRLDGKMSHLQPETEDRRQ